jgi:hypothetical protein
MQSLVHLATQVWIKGEGRTVAAVGKATQHLAMVFPNHYTNRSLWREYLPHAFRILQHSEGHRMKERSDFMLLGWAESDSQRTDQRSRHATRAGHRYEKECPNFAQNAITLSATTFDIPKTASFEKAAAVPLAAMTVAVALYRDMDYW